MNIFGPQCRGTLLLLGLMSFVNVVSSTRTASGQESPAPSTESVRVDDPEFSRLPPGLSKSAPESIADLREIETRVQALIKKVSECTVALQVGPAQGSGVIVSADGYVLTAAHVSGTPGRRISIRLPDGTRASGRTLGRNRTLDASLVKIDDPQQSWPHLKMADLSDMEHGAWCLVTGHPGGFQESRPPVIRLGRVIYADQRVIRTDCELVGGDSGGPLIDLKGQVIGINSRIGEDTTFNLHVPVSVYETGWDQMLASKTFSIHTGSFLGVQGEQAPEGVILTKVHPNQPAADVGMRVGDVILTFEGIPVESMDDLVELVGEEAPGRPVTITLLRDGKVIELKPRLGIRDNESE